MTMCNVLVHNLSPLANHNINIVVVMDGNIPEMKLNHSMAKNGCDLPLRNVTFTKKATLPDQKDSRDIQESEESEGADCGMKDSPVPTTYTPARHAFRRELPCGSNTIPAERRGRTYDGGGWTHIGSEIKSSSKLRKSAEYRVCEPPQKKHFREHSMSAVLVFP